MRNLYIVLTFLPVLIFSGCEEIMDLQFEGSGLKTLVVEGQITTDTMAHQVMLSWTGDFFNKLNTAKFRKKMRSSLNPK